MFNQTMGLDYQTLGEHFTVPVHTSKVPDAEVIWINKQYFLDQNLDIFSEQVLDKIKNYLLDSFAVEAREGDGKPAHILYADRYGSSTGTFHGGSGRSASLGVFNAKGIGRTPLTSPHVDKVHCDGCLSIVEAIREAICSEIASEELPHSAIPVLAIIDLKKNHNFHNGVYTKAVIIRQNFIRPAHYERSVYFGSSGSPTSDQYRDALRVKSIVSNKVVSSQVENVPQMFSRFCEQIGTARALRLWQGQFTSSNISVDGKIVDFGSFRGVAHWRKSYGGVGEIFGEESDALIDAAKSIAFYLKKYGSDPTYEFNFTKDDIDKCIHDAFLKSCMVGLSKSASEIDKIQLMEAIEIYFKEQQTWYVKVDHRPDLKLSWIYKILTSNLDTNRLDGYSASALRIRQILLKNLESSYCTAKFWLKPRIGIFYNISIKKISHFLKFRDRSNLNFNNELDKFITRQVLQNRRYFPSLENDIELMAYTSGNGYFAYFGERDRSKIVVVDCNLIDGKIHCFETSFDFENMKNNIKKVCSNRIRIELDFDWNDLKKNLSIVLNGKKLNISSWHEISKI